MRLDFKKIFAVCCATFAFLIIAVFLLYFLILPKTINSPFAVNFVQKIVKEQLNLDLEVNNIYLETSFKPEIELKIDRLNLTQKNNEVLLLEDFDFAFKFNKIFKKEITLDKLSSKRIIFDLDKLLANLPESSNQAQTPDIKFNFSNADVNIDDFSLNYLQNKTLIEAYLKNIKIENQILSFESVSKISKNNKNLAQIKLNSTSEIKISNEDIKIDNLKIAINDSILKLDSKIDMKNISLNAKSDRFYLADVFNLINSDLVIPNGEQMLLPLKNPKGNVAFDVNLNNFDLSGWVDVNNTGAEIKDVSNIPVYVSDGIINITKDKIIFNDLKGYYGKNKTNKIHITGDIKDYYKTFDSNILVESIITNEFFKDYLAPLINNTELYVSKPSKTKVIYKSKNNIMDIIWFAQIDKGVDFGVTKEKSALSDYDRAVLGEFQIDKDKLNIKNINYYIASNIVRGVKLKPIIQINGLMNLDGSIDKIGFAFGRELPSEFLNVFVGQKLFKKGTIKGNLEVEFKNNIPYLIADMEMKKVLIPSQRVFLKDMHLMANNEHININTQGKFKRANFDFRGKIKNGLVAPFVIKNLTLELDNVDVERILTSFNNQESSQVAQNNDIEEVLDDNYMFDTNLIRIENCDFKLNKGNYKELSFGNINANLTLDDKGILKIKSNKFDIAQGISTLKLICDLKELKYYIRLGVKGIDSNLMARTLFNLDKEITGLADGLIELNGDKTLKMNGDIKFLINEGTIGKVGLVEYLMKIASVFRNPIVMVSPATIMDIISIPEGKFDKIEGNIKIKDNVLAPIDIKSYSKTLSALIKGKFDMERHDASIRIYTRFSTDKKSMFGVLRNLSLNSLANKVKRSSNIDSNYYESELVQLPQIEVEEEKSQVFLTQVEGDIEHFNFLSSLKKIK